MKRNKGCVGLALLAMLALTITATVSATASASGGSAVSAKKKCKKKKASSAKKKKCKKKNGTGTGTGTTPPIPLVRATLTWSGGGDSTDYNLYVFDPSGSTGSVLSDPVASTSFSPNVKGSSGTETFTDLDSGKHRAFGFGVCHQDGGNDGSAYSIDYVSANGTHFTDTQSGTGDGYNARYSDSGGAPATNTFTCPA